MWQVYDETAFVIDVYIYLGFFLNRRRKVGTHLSRVGWLVAAAVFFSSVTMTQ